MAVSFEELHGSPTEDSDREGFRATRRLRCAWGSRLALRNQLLLGMGQPYPHYPLARARKVAIAPADGKQMGSGSTTAYEKAVLTVTYETPGDGTVEADSNDNLVSERLSGSGEFVTLPVESAAGDPLFRWADANGDPLVPQEAPGKIIRTIDYSVTRYEMAEVPAGLYDLIGTTNQSPVNSLLLGWTFPAETLLYNRPDQSRQITSNGAQAWTITQNFTYRPSGWNKFWRASSGQFERMYSVEAGATYFNYPLADFFLLN